MQGSSGQAMKPSSLGSGRPSQLMDRLPAAKRGQKAKRCEHVETSEKSGTESAPRRRSQAAQPMCAIRRVGGRIRPSGLFEFPGARARPEAGDHGLGELDDVDARADTPEERAR